MPLTLGAFILYWIYKDFDFSYVGDTLANNTDYGWMALTLVFGILSHVVRGWRWKQTLAPLGEYPQTGNCVNAVFISYAANLIVPRIGEISRCGILSKYDGVSFSKSLGTVVSERLIDTLCVGLITCLTLVLQMKIFDRFFQTTGTDWSAIAGVFTTAHFYIILLCAVGVLVLFYYLVRSFSIFNKVRKAARNVWEGILSLKKVENKPLFAFYTFLIWLFYFLQFYLSFFCFDFSRELGIQAGLVLFVAGSIAVVVPTPNGAGAWHFAVISMMTLYGVSKADAGIFALLVHGIQTFLIILLGVYGATMLSFTNKKRKYENH